MLLKTSAITVFGGPNLHAAYPVIRYRFQIRDVDAVKMASISADFISLVLQGRKPPSIDQMIKSGEGVSAAFLASHIFMECVLDLQQEAGVALPEAHAVNRAEDGLWDCYIPFTQEEICRRAALEIFKLMNHLEGLSDRGPVLETLPKRIAEFRKWLKRQFRQASYSTPLSELIQVAEKRGIPWRRFHPEKSILHLGYGSSRKALDNTICSAESHLAAEAANNKEQTILLLKDAGLPVPEQRVVVGEKRALKVMEKLSFPVAVKPLYGLKGYGVTPRVIDSQALVEAVHKASRFRKYIIVEQHIPGSDYRLQITGGKFTGAILRTPARIIGTGEASITELVQSENAAPWRWGENGTLRYGIRKNPETTQKLKDQGLGWQEVPEKGQEVILQDIANVSQGGSYVSVSDQIHPENIKMAERAAAAIGLKVAGIDFITQDITRPYWETGGKICEVNLMPNLDVIEPYDDQPLYQYERVIDQIFPPGSTSSAPTLAILSDAASRIIPWLEKIFEFHDLTVGKQQGAEAFIANSPLMGVETVKAAAQSILWNPAVDVALLVLDANTIREEGLAFGRVDHVFLEKMPTYLDNEPASDAALLLMRQATKTISFNGVDEILAAWIGTVEEFDVEGINGQEKTMRSIRFLGSLAEDEKQACLIAINLAKKTGVSVGEDCFAHLAFGGGNSADEAEIPIFLKS